MSAEEFKRQIEALCAEYRADLPGRLAELNRLWNELGSGAPRPERMVELRRNLHSIAGSARTFGVAGVSEAAAAAEIWLDPYCATGSLPGPAERIEFQHLLDGLKRAAGISE